METSQNLQLLSAQVAESYVPTANEQRAFDHGMQVSRVVSLVSIGLAIERVMQSLVDEIGLEKDPFSEEKLSFFTYQTDFRDKLIESTLQSQQRSDLVDHDDTAKNLLQILQRAKDLCVWFLDGLNSSRSKLDRGEHVAEDVQRHFVTAAQKLGDLTRDLGHAVKDCKELAGRLRGLFGNDAQSPTQGGES